MQILQQRIFPTWEIGSGLEGYAAPSEAQGVGQEGRTRDLRPRGGFSSVQQVTDGGSMRSFPSPCRKIQLPHRLQKTEDQRFPGQEKEDRGAALGKNKSAQVPAWCDGGKPDKCAISPKIWYNMIVERIYPLSRQDLPLPVSAVPDPGFLLRHQGGFHFRLDLQGIRKDREGVAGQGHLKCLPLPRVHAQAVFPSPGETLSRDRSDLFPQGERHRVRGHHPGAWRIDGSRPQRALILPNLGNLPPWIRPLEGSAPVPSKREGQAKETEPDMETEGTPHPESRRKPPGRRHSPGHRVRAGSSPDRLQGTEDQRCPWAKRTAERRGDRPAKSPANCGPVECLKRSANSEKIGYNYCRRAFTPLFAGSGTARFPRSEGRHPTESPFSAPPPPPPRGFPFTHRPTRRRLGRA